MDFPEICEQVDRVACHQLILLDGTAQALRPRLTDDVVLDEALALTQTLAALTSLMLRWAAVLLPGHAPEEDVCPACLAHREAENGDDD